MKKQRKVLPKRLVVWAAKGMFKSAKKLAEALKPDTNKRVLILRPGNIKYKQRKEDLNINWGCGNNLLPMPILNRPSAVRDAINKLETFKLLQDKVNIPEWTTDPAIANNWNTSFIGRQTLTGFGGKGILFFDPKYPFAEGGLYPAPENIENRDACPLYVQYKKKKKEFRVHVFGNEVIDVTQKKKRTDFDGEINTKIRNYGNGWVYCREGIEIPDDLFDQAKKAIEAVGLDFGAVDIIWNEKENKSYVLEINTAPGLEGTTIESYKNAILNEIK